MNDTQTIERTVKLIANFWTKTLGNSFHPDSNPHSYRLPCALIERFERDMDYLYLNASNPYQYADPCIRPE
jgi:hypothetical protein